MNSKGPSFSVPKPWGPKKWLYISICSAETAGARLSYIWLKDTTIGCGTDCHL